MKGIIFDWMGTLYRRGSGLFTYSERILRLLKPNYRLGLVTLAKGGIETRRIEIEASGIVPLFDSVIISDKKSPEQYLQCMREMGTSPDETAIVDDRTVRGIKVGNILGCETFWIQKGEYSYELPNKETGEPTHKINSVEDLVRLL